MRKIVNGLIREHEGRKVPVPCPIRVSELLLSTDVWAGALIRRAELEGAYATEEARFDVGDFEEADPEVLHQPRVVSDKPCLCVVALDGQIKLDGWLGPLFQPFARL